MTIKEMREALIELCAKNNCYKGNCPAYRQCCKTGIYSPFVKTDAEIRRFYLGCKAAKVDIDMTACTAEMTKAHASQHKIITIP